MTRLEFLRQVGLGAAFVLTVPCLHSCDKGDDGDGDGPTTPAEVDFTIDTAAAPYADQFANRGFVVERGVVIARLTAGGFAAASQTCSHERRPEVTYDQTDDLWFCTAHGAEFARADGAPTNSVTPNPLRIYTTSLDGTMLRVS